VHVEYLLRPINFASISGSYVQRNHQGRKVQRDPTALLKFFFCNEKQKETKHKLDW